ncbi:MAG: hypothetical protein WB630_13405 [Candidatus Acidiferrales bacterium]
MSNQEEFVTFMTLPFGIDESIIPGVLASRGIPVHLVEQYLARQGPMSRFKFPLRALKMLGERLMTQNGWTVKARRLRVSRNAAFKK